MMNYLRQDNPHLFRSGSRTGRWLAIIAIAIVVVFVVFPHTSSSVVYRIVSPLWRAENAADTEKNELIMKLQGFATVDEKIKMLTKENHELKARLERRVEPNTALAVVLRHPPATAYDTLIVDIGESDGVRVGNVVSIFGGDPVGIVETVSAHTAQVKLYSSPGYELDALVGENSLPIHVIGMGGGNFTAKVPHDMEVVVGDVITLPGIMPAVLGIIEDIIVDPSRSFKVIHFKSPVAISALSWVEVSK